MPDDDTMLAQGTVDFRDEGRRSRVFDQLITIEGLDYTDQTAELTVAFCTQDAQCGAEADQHLDGCPVEERLREEFAF